MPTTDDLLSSLLDEFKAFAKVQEGKAAKHNEYREKRGCAGDVSIEVLVQAIRRPHRDRRVPQGDVILSF